MIGGLGWVHCLLQWIALVSLVRLVLLFDQCYSTGWKFVNGAPLAQDRKPAIRRRALQIRTGTLRSSALDHWNLGNSELHWNNLSPRFVCLLEISFCLYFSPLPFSILYGSQIIKLLFWYIWITTYEFLTLHIYATSRDECIC